MDDIASHSAGAHEGGAGLALPAQQQELARLIDRHANIDGVHATAIRSLHLIRAAQPGEPVHAVHQPALCIVAQGQKKVMLADSVYQYDPAQYLLVSVDLPVAGQVTQASEASPYLCLRLDIDLNALGELLAQVEHTPTQLARMARGLMLSSVTPGLLDVVLRLTRLLDTPDDIPVLAPLAVREVLYRVLQGEQGALLRSMVNRSGRSQSVVKAIRLIKENYTRPLGIETLSREVNMSASSLHQHFKAVTDMTPLQYQKTLRLQEARRLLAAAQTDVAAVARCGTFAQH